MMHKKMINEAMRIAGEKVTSDKTIDVEYPFTGEVIGTVPAGTAAVSYTHLTLPTICSV